MRDTSNSCMQSCTKSYYSIEYSICVNWPKIVDTTALFTNMRILKFKSQLTIAFFAAVNHLNGPLRKQNFILTGLKGHGL